MVSYVRYVVILWGTQWKEICSWHVKSVVSLCAGHVMSMKGGKVLKIVLSARPDIRESKV